MKLRRLSLANVRSFREEASLIVERDFAIIVGPNGGGKTNLLDALMLSLQRHVFNDHLPRRSPTANNPRHHVVATNDGLRNTRLSRHHDANNGPQRVELIIEATSADADNMARMAQQARQLYDRAKPDFDSLPIAPEVPWSEPVPAGSRHRFAISNDSLEPPADDKSNAFRQYLARYKADAAIRTLYPGEFEPLSHTLLYLPVTRSASVIQGSIALPSFDAGELQRGVDATHSRSSGQLADLAIGSLAERYLAILHQDRGGAMERFRQTRAARGITDTLERLGYSWQLKCTSTQKNSFSVEITKNGRSFDVLSASSGEREILIYALAIYALDIEQALVVIDEPELHLHPKWQRLLLEILQPLATATGNQFILATHAAAFITPKSVGSCAKGVYRRRRQQNLQLPRRTAGGQASVQHCQQP